MSRRALEGVPDWYRAMSGVTSRGNLSMSRRALDGAPDWYRQMQGTTLGDDTLAAMSDETFRAELLSGQKKLLEAQKHWAEGDRMQKWIAIGATLAIPLSAAIWRMLGIGRRRR